MLGAYWHDLASCQIARLQLQVVQQFLRLYKFLRIATAVVGGEALRHVRLKMQPRMLRMGFWRCGGLILCWGELDEARLGPVFANGIRGWAWHPQGAPHDL